MADEPYVVYCDDYEAITGQKRVVQKVVKKAADEPEPESTDEAETK